MALIIQHTAAVAKLPGQATEELRVALLHKDAAPVLRSVPEEQRFDDPQLSAALHADATPLRARQQAIPPQHPSKQALTSCMHAGRQHAVLIDAQQLKIKGLVGTAKRSV
jgi:hypothetical protein